ncbi:FHA domain-containing protein [Sinorhizobium medicae]|nr:FHA domain-containing protein [Sinorhizobium medicae]MDX0685844.1 FHA domain-containing protein [Sinorhizobium medicae]MDX0691749.1 FHA domain-containing protein [Sinorhizobium medicae]MDX0790217.1 FHA domain-containing protein [Sinorhizobium medicae]MDX0919230.1 FHA domain-containing protein [Sinorhizobium medicae]
MKTILNLHRNLAKSVAGFLCEAVGRACPKPTKRTRRAILVVGGGPVGLAFATTLRALAGEAIEITVADGRWTPEGRTVRWRNATESVNRREQVVTVQSLVFNRMPGPVQSAMFPIGGYREIWPTGRESPVAHGFPRNVRIRDLEDRLLGLARDQGVTLLAKNVEPSELSLDHWDLVVIADGANSRMRDHFSAYFGRADPLPYSLNGEQVVDTVLGLRVKSTMTNASSVVMTVAQQRFLLNANDGDGLLYMRLTDAEAAEARGRPVKGVRFVDCLQSAPCHVTWRRNDVLHGSYLCALRGSEFIPPTDPNSFLWPRVQQGLKLFDITEDNVTAITTFRLAMTRRAAFCAELTPTGSARPVFGALIGDAAGVTHFWPGRGLNRGLSSAYALAVVLSRCGQSDTLRMADFVAFEGVMAQLQARHQDRAWRAMVQLRGTEVKPVKTIVLEALLQPAGDRQKLIDAMFERVSALSAGLSGRLPAQPDLDELSRALDRIDDETLATLVATGSWETRASGGAEIDVANILALTQDAA